MRTRIDPCVIGGKVAIVWILVLFRVSTEAEDLNVGQGGSKENAGAAHEEEAWLPKLKTGRVAERREAIEKLGGVRSLKAVPVLVALVEEDETLGVQASTALVRIGMDAASRLLVALKTRDADFRERAVTAILKSTTDEKSSAFVLVKLGLKDPDMRVSEVAIKGLGKVARAAVPLLIRALGDNSIVFQRSREPITWIDDREIRVNSRAIEGLVTIGSDAEEAVPALVKLLRSESDISWAAGAALAAIGSAAVPSLLDAFKDPKTRRAAANALMRMGPPAKAALPFLVDALKDPDYGIREYATLALEKIGPDAKDAIPALLAVLRDPLFYHREATSSSGPRGSDCEAYEIVARALGKIGPQTSEVIPALIGALADDHPCLRESAAEALGELGPKAKDAAPALMALLTKPNDVADDKSRWAHGNPAAAAAEALGKIGVEAKVVAPALLAASRSPNAAVRLKATEALEKVNEGGEETIPSLIRALADESDRTFRVAKVLAKKGTRAIPELLKAMSSQNSRVRRGAVYSLGQIGPEAKKAIPALVKAFSDPESDIRWEAAYSLQRIKGEASVPTTTLIETLKDNSPYLRERAVKFLGSKDREASSVVPALVSMLKDNEADVRSSAAYALGRLGQAAKDAIPALLQALKDTSVGRWQVKEYSVQDAAAWALGKMGLPALSGLLQVLEEGDRVARPRAARALGEMGPEAKEAVPLLLSLLKDDDKELRKETETALKNIGASEDAIDQARRK